MGYAMEFRRNIKMEFTTEQQEHIDKLIAEKTTGLFTEEELNKRVTSEVDRRVESGIQKGLETQKTKWESDYKTKAQLSAEEVAKLEVKEQLDNIARREAEINTRSNTIDARDLLSSAEIPQEDYSKFMKLLISDNAEATKANVMDFIDTFNNTKKNIETEVKKKLSNIPAPKGDPEGEYKKSTGVQDFIQIASEGNIRKH